MEGKTCRKYKLIWNFLQVHFRVQVVVIVVIIEAAEVSMTDVTFFVFVVPFDVVRFSLSSIVADDVK